MSTLFTPIARLEVVQALSELRRIIYHEDHTDQSVIMAAWGDTSWRPGGELASHCKDINAELTTRSRTAHRVGV